MNDLKLKPGELGEIFFKNRPDLGTLYSIRQSVFNAKNLQEVLDKVQKEINEVVREEREKH